MKQEDVKTWVAALRSGEYEQAQEYLCFQHPGEKSSYCCLGVMINELVEGDWERSGHSWMYGDEGGSMEDFPVPSVRKELGLSASWGKTLAHLNDAGAGFEKIADVIEAYGGSLGHGRAPGISRLNKEFDLDLDLKD